MKSGTTKGFTNSLSAFSMNGRKLWELGIPVGVGGKGYTLVLLQVLKTLMVPSVI